MLAHTIHANIHTYIHIICETWSTKIRGDLLKKESFELSLKLREGGQIWQTGRQQIPDGLSDETVGVLTKRFQIASRDFQKLLA